MTRAMILAWLLELIRDTPPPSTLAMFGTESEVRDDSAIDLTFDGAFTFRIRVDGPLEVEP